MISLPCPDDGSYRLIRFVVTLASWKAHIQKCLHPCFLDLLTVHCSTCFILLGIHKHLSNACQSLDVICLFKFSICPVVLSNSCENKQKSFQLSSVLMLVLDLYLLCMTLVPWKDKGLFSINMKDDDLLVFSYYIRCQIYHVFFSEMNRSACICSS